MIANGKKDEAREVIDKAAKRSGVKLTSNVFEETNSVDEKTETETVGQPIYGFSDMFRKSQITITLPLLFCWPVITLLFYGLSLSADKIHMTDNVYLSFILVSLIEIPSHLLTPLAIDVLGRKPLFFLTQFIPGICCITAAFLPPGIFGSLICYKL